MLTIEIVEADLCDHWQAGGRPAFCYLIGAHHCSMNWGDFISAAQFDWLLDILAIKEGLEPDELNQSIAASHCFAAATHH